MPVDEEGIGCSKAREIIILCFALLFSLFYFNMKSVRLISY
ncbi:hypothetical protein D1BOALGB6SA_574 [Olavius sp. associated proteobacterium Delta 1]|nr:hypothetical protein D1BOALGB6SA_574 [Olavius sp. associated proteobacterium Delta 1]